MEISRKWRLHSQWHVPRSFKKYTEWLPTFCQSCSSSLPPPRSCQRLSLFETVPHFRVRLPPIDKADPGVRLNAEGGWAKMALLYVWGSCVCESGHPSAVLPDRLSCLVTVLILLSAPFNWFCNVSLHNNGWEHSRLWGLKSEVLTRIKNGWLYTYRASDRVKKAFYLTEVDLFTAQLQHTWTSVRTGRTNTCGVCRRIAGKSIPPLLPQWSNFAQNNSRWHYYTLSISLEVNACFLFFWNAMQVLWIRFSLQLMQLLLKSFLVLKDSNSPAGKI